MLKLKNQSFDHYNPTVQVSMKSLVAKGINNIPLAVTGLSKVRLKVSLTATNVPILERAFGGLTGAGDGSKLSYSKINKYLIVTRPDLGCGHLARLRNSTLQSPF